MSKAEFLTNGIDMTFRQMELPHTHIEHCVSLYNTGLYEDIILKNLANTIGPTGAFHEKYVPRIRFRPKKKNRTVSKFVHLAPHRHSGLMHQLQREREFHTLPLKYFVGITHSGHSVSPWKKGIWAKHEGVEETVEGPVNADEYGFPRTKCYEHFRMERNTELEVYPLKQYCNLRGRRRSEEEERNPTRRIGAIIHLKSRVTPARDYPVVTKPYDGRYEVVRRVSDLKQTRIEELIGNRAREVPKIIVEEEADKKGFGNSEEEETVKAELVEGIEKSNPREVKKWTATISMSSRKEAPLTISSVSVIHPEPAVHLLSPANEFQSVALNPFIDKHIGQQQYSKFQEDGEKRTKKTARIFLKDTTRKEEGSETQKQQNVVEQETQEIRPLVRRTEFKYHPIEGFVAKLPLTNDGPAKISKKPKLSAKLYVKSAISDQQLGPYKTRSETLKQLDPEDSKQYQQFHSLAPKKEFKQFPIEDFVTTKQPSTSILQNDLKKPPKLTAKLYLKNSSIPSLPNNQNQPNHPEHKLIRPVNPTVIVTESTGEGEQPCTSSKVVTITLVKKEQVNGEERRNADGKRMSRKRKRKSLVGTIVQHVTSGKKDTKKKNKKKKEGKPSKKQKLEQKKKQRNVDHSTTGSSSSSSSSSSDAEAEEIHVLVHEEKQKLPESVRRENLQQQLPHEPLIVEENSVQIMIALSIFNIFQNASPLTHTKVRTWHEESKGPEQVTTEVDEHGNVIKRIVTTEHVKHTVHTQSYQTMAVEDDENAKHSSPNPPMPPPRVPPKGVERVVTFENGIQQNGGAEQPGEVVSTKTVTTGNRTIETVTYKKEKDGLVETRVEHRITIHSNEDIDHEAELNRAILEATNMNPDMKVEKVEVERGSS